MRMRFPVGLCNVDTNIIEVSNIIKMSTNDMDHLKWLELAIFHEATQFGSF